VNCGCCGGNIIDNIVIMDNKMKVKDTCSIKILRGKTGKVIDKDGNMRYFVLILMVKEVGYIKII